MMCICRIKGKRNRGSVIFNSRNSCQRKSCTWKWDDKGAGRFGSAPIRLSKRLEFQNFSPNWNWFPAHPSLINFPKDQRWSHISSYAMGSWESAKFRFSFSALKI